MNNKFLFNDKTDIELLEICNLAQEGSCLEKKWGECPYPSQDDDNGGKCGLCTARYIIERLGYHK